MKIGGCFVHRDILLFMAVAKLAFIEGLYATILDEDKLM